MWKNKLGDTHDLLYHDHGRNPTHWGSKVKTQETSHIFMVAGHKCFSWKPGQSSGRSSGSRARGMSVSTKLRLSWKITAWAVAANEEASISVVASHTLSRRSLGAERSLLLTPWYWLSWYPPMWHLSHSFTSLKDGGCLDNVPSRARRRQQLWYAGGGSYELPRSLILGRPSPRL